MNQNVFCKNCHRIPDQCRCNTAPKELSDEEIYQIGKQYLTQHEDGLYEFARAILKKASEK